MSKGGNDYREQAMQAIRFAGVLVTPVLAVYSLLVVLDIAPTDHFINPFISLSIAITWFAVSIYYYLVPIKSRTTLAVRLIIFHAFTFAMFAFSTGLAQPFAPLFVLLFFATKVYFGYRGLALSMLSLVLFAIVDTALHASLNPEIIYENAVTTMSILILGVALLAIVSAQETRRMTLLHSQERERLQYERILTIINNLTDATFSTNEKGDILMYNAAALDLLDTNDSIKGKNIGDLLNLTDTNKTSTNLYEVLQGITRATRRDDLSHTYSDDESVRLEITAAPIRSSFNISTKKEVQGGYIVIMRDVTKQKSLEEERDEFISVVSHELRTPITIVEGTLSNLAVMMQQPELPTKKALVGAVDTAHDQTLYLAKMVNDLSTLSRAERGVADEPEEIDVKTLLHDMHHRYQAEAEEQALHLNLDLGSHLGSVTASRLYLEELLQNFITNAIKYTKAGSVTIIAKRSKDTVTFAVKDSGIGISRTDQAKIFDKFYRSEDYRIRETGGTGLGLYVSAKLARKLYTHIQLKSRLNHGSTFSFELPVTSHGK